MPPSGPSAWIILSPTTRILILVDDITRQTPSAGILPSLALPPDEARLPVPEYQAADRRRYSRAYDPSGNRAQDRPASSSRLFLDRASLERTWQPRGVGATARRHADPHQSHVARIRFCDWHRHDCSASRYGFHWRLNYRAAGSFRPGRHWLYPLGQREIFREGIWAMRTIRSAVKWSRSRAKLDFATSSTL